MGRRGCEGVGRVGVGRGCEGVGGEGVSQVMHHHTMHSPYTGEGH